MHGEVRFETEASLPPKPTPLLLFLQKSSVNWDGKQLVSKNMSNNNN